MTGRRGWRMEHKAATRSEWNNEQGENSVTTFVNRTTNAMVGHIAFT